MCEKLLSKNVGSCYQEMWEIYTMMCGEDIMLREVGIMLCMSGSRLCRCATNLCIVADVTPAVFVKLIVAFENLFEEFALIFVIERFISAKTEIQNAR